MIKLIIHCSDIHIRNAQRHEEYAEQLTRFIDKCKEISEPYEREEVRILIAGDLVHQKLIVSNELFSFTSMFIRNLESIAQVLVISGNHDLLIDNKSKKDTMSAIFETASFQNSIFIDSLLGYKSGVIIDDNVAWALYSIYDDYKRPDIETAIAENPDCKVIGVYHGPVCGVTLNNGLICNEGVTDGSIFQGCDVVMAGDIHKRQIIKSGDVKIVYPGSLIQQTFGETITQHGFAAWNVENLTPKFIDLETNYGLYDFEINDINDIEEDKEILINY